MLNSLKINARCIENKFAPEQNTRIKGWSLLRRVHVTEVPCITIQVQLANVVYSHSIARIFSSAWKKTVDEVALSRRISQLRLTEE